MRVCDASTPIWAEFGGIQDLSRHLFLNWLLAFILFIYSINLKFPASEVPNFPTPGPPSFLVWSGQSLVYKYIYSSWNEGYFCI